MKKLILADIKRQLNTGGTYTEYQQSNHKNTELTRRLGLGSFANSVSYMVERLINSHKNK